MQSFIFWMFLYQDHVELFLIILWPTAHEPMFVSFIHWDLGTTNLIWSKSEGKLGMSPTWVYWKATMVPKAKSSENV